MITVLSMVGEAVRFLVRVKELVEDPETLLLEG